MQQISGPRRLKDVADSGFAAFVADRQAALLRLAMVLTGDAVLSQDIVADVLSRAFERWPRIAQTEQPYAYVRRMVINEHVSWRRRLRRFAFGFDREFPQPLADDPATAHAERDAMLRRLASLPPKQRAVIVLRFYDGLSDAEIAAAMHCAESTVRSNIARALAALRIELTEPMAEPMTSNRKR